MASGPSVDAGIDCLNALFGGIAFTPPPAVDIRFWTVAPGFDGTGGTEVTGGGYAPASLSVSGAVAGTGGKIATIASDAVMTWVDMPVASTSVVAASAHNAVTGALIWLNDSWTPPASWAVGDNPQIGVGAFLASFVPAS